MLTTVRPLAAAFLLLFSALSAAQTPSTPTGTVRGQVLCSDTQQPARLAHVVLQPLVDLQSPVLKKEDHSPHREGIFHLQTVSLDGSFVLDGVQAGLYYVIVEQDGYISPLALFTREQLNHPDEAMLRRISRYMTPISVTAGHTTQTQVSLVRGAVVQGSVHFEDGSPAVGVNLALLQHNPDGKWATARTGHIAGRMNSNTDDQGNFRFSGLPAGEYLVRASIELNNVITDHIFASGGGTSYGDGYHLQIFPGDTFRTRDAKPLKLEEGETASGVSIDVPLSKLYSLTGTVLRPDSESPANAAHLTLQFADGNDELTSADVDENDGSFRFDFVPAGNYVLKASRIAQVQRTEVPNCDSCIPPSHTETKTVATFGDNSQAIALTSDQTGVVVHAKPAASK